MANQSGAFKGLHKKICNLALNCFMIMFDDRISKHLI